MARLSCANGKSFSEKTLDKSDFGAIMKGTEQHEDGEGLRLPFSESVSFWCKKRVAAPEDYPSRAALKTLFAAKASVGLR